MPRVGDAVPAVRAEQRTGDLVRIDTVGPVQDRRGGHPGGAARLPGRTWRAVPAGEGRVPTAGRPTCERTGALSGPGGRRRRDGRTAVAGASTVAVRALREQLAGPRP